MQKMINVVQLVTFRAIKYVAQPDIMRIDAPRTLLQRLAYWLGEQTHLIRPYTPVMPVENVKIIRLEKSARETIERAVIDFMNDDPRINPERDLVILWGHDGFAEFVRNPENMRTDMMFCRNDGRRYHGIGIRLVHYISGPLVLRRADLA